MQKYTSAILKTTKLNFEMKAWTPQVCCARIALLCGLSDWCRCDMHSFNTTIKQVKLRKVSCLINFSLSHPHFRHQQVQSSLCSHSRTHAHTMNMHLLSLHLTLRHTRYLFLACSSHFSLSFFFFSSVFLSTPPSLTHTQKKQYLSSYRINITVQISFGRYSNISLWQTPCRRLGYCCIIPENCLTYANPDHCRQAYSIQYNYSPPEIRHHCPVLLFILFYLSVYSFPIISFALIQQPLLLHQLSLPHAWSVLPSLSPVHRFSPQYHICHISADILQAGSIPACLSCNKLFICLPFMASKGFPQQKHLLLPFCWPGPMKSSVAHKGRGIFPKPWV